MAVHLYHRFASKLAPTMDCGDAARLVLSFKADKFEILKAAFD